MTKQVLTLAALAILFPSYLLTAQLTRKSVICPNACTATPGNFQAFNGELYFNARNNEVGYELFKYDGINDPVLIHDIAIGITPSTPKDFQVFDGKLFFSATDGATYQNNQLWMYDGLHAPVKLASYLQHDIDLQVFKDELYVLAKDTLHVYNGNGSPFDRKIPLYTSGQRIVGVTADYLYITGNAFTKLYRHDGLSLSPDLGLAVSNATLGSAPVGVTVGSTFYFIAKDATHGLELWKDVGTGAPSMIADINPGSANGLSLDIVNFNGTVCFLGDDGINGTELWKYDGVDAPSMVADIFPGGYASPRWFAVVNNLLVFNASDLDHGSELWKYDGVSAPELVKDQNTTGMGFFYPVDMYTFNNKVYMSGDGGDGFGRELWEYDPAFVATSIDMEQKENGIRLYPNPAAAGQELHLETDQAVDQIRILNAIGVEVYRGKELTAINKSGLYFIEVEQKGKKTISKLIVQ